MENGVPVARSYITTKVHPNEPVENIYEPRKSYGRANFTFFVLTQTDS